jgi:hypothetical protein
MNPRQQSVRLGDLLSVIGYQGSSVSAGFARPFVYFRGTTAGFLQPLPLVSCHS